MVGFKIFWKWASNRVPKLYFWRLRQSINQSIINFPVGWYYYIMEKSLRPGLWGAWVWFFFFTWSNNSWHVGKGGFCCESLQISDLHFTVIFNTSCPWYKIPFMLPFAPPLSLSTPCVLAPPPLPRSFPPPLPLSPPLLHCLALPHSIKPAQYPQSKHN